MNLSLIVKLILVALINALTSIPLTIWLIKNKKIKKLAIERAKKAQAESEIKDELKNQVRNAEIMYRDINVILKTQGTSAGAMKKAEVMKSLKVFCLENNYEWNEEKMSDAVEKEVEYTKKVNCNNENQI